MTETRQRHWVVAKNILRYLRGAITYGMRYTSSGGLLLHGYEDVDWAGSPVNRKSTSGYCFILGSTMISWSRRKQRMSTLQQVILERKKYGLENWFLGCLVTSSR
jgi:hypothetical protein